MAFIEPLGGRAKITDLGRQVRIEIPLRPQGFCGLEIVAFSVFWIIGWGVGEVAVGSWLLHRLGLLPQPLFNLIVQNPEAAETFWFMTGWLLLWTIMGGFFCSHLVNLSFGREVIVVTSTSLSIVHRPIGFVHHYKLSEISNLRVVERGPCYSEFTGTGIRCSIRRTIAFDQGGKTIWFGIGLDPAEARQIVALIKGRFGQYMKVEETF